MLEEEFRVDNQNDSRENSESEIQVDNFSKTTKLLDKKLKDKKDNILKVLEKGNLKDLFERLLLSDTEDKRKCIEELLTCENDEIKIKEVILANLPDGYAYNVSTGQVGVLNNNFSGATTTDKKEEEVVKKEEEVVKKEEEVVKKEEEVKSNKEKIERAMDIAKVARQNLLNNHPKGKEIDEKTKKKAELAKQQLSEETKKQLEEKGYDENFINDYILLRVTLNEVRNDSSFDKNAVAEFEKGVNGLSKIDIILKNIDNACNIPDTNLNSFSKDNIGDTRKEMFNADVGNNNLISARDSNKESHSAEYGELFKDTDIMDTIKKYGKFFPEGAKQYLKKYEEYYKSGKGLEYENSDEGKKLKETLLNVKVSVDNYTENFIEEMCLMSHIKGMTMCMGEDFNINKAREINNENGVLTIEGHINGIDFGLRHDTNNPDSLLQTSSKFSASPDKGSFTIRSKPEFTDNADSNFILPSQTEVFNLVTQRVKTAMNKGGILDNAGSRDEFKNALENELQNDIIGKIDVFYKNTEYTHHYITDKVRSEQIVDNAVGLIKSINPSETNLPGEISITSNPKLFNFIKILSFNLENSTAEEKNKLDESITQIKEIIRENKNNNGDDTGEISSIPIAAGSIAADYLKAEKRNSSGDKETKDSQRNLISELFSQYSIYSPDARYSKNIGEGIAPKMIINDLHKDLIESNNGSNKSQTSQDRSNKQKILASNETTKKEQKNADFGLDLALKDFPPSPEPPYNIA